MPSERYFIDESLLLSEQKVLKESEFHHLAHVMRTKIGELIEIVNGRGILAQARVKEIGKKEAILFIEEVVQESPSSHPVILAQAIPKMNRLDFILEKGTELGVDAFWLFPSHHSPKKDFSSQQLERMHSVAISAMKQCGRLFSPKIIVQPPVEKWPSQTGSLFFGDISPEAPLFSDRWNQKQICFPILFFVGPESGFTEKEVSFLKEMGVEGVKLHHNILRTDTAALVALSLIQHWLIK